MTHPAPHRRARRRRRAVCCLTVGLLVAAPLSGAAPAVAEPATTAPPASARPTPGSGASAGAGAPDVTDPALRQDVTAEERIVTGAAEVERGHVDLGPRLIDGRWTLLGRDDTQSPPVWRSPDDLVLRVNDSARMAVPDEKQYEFLGLGGKPAWVIPQTQDQKVVWLGWNTQAPEVVAAFPRGVDLVVTGHSGPGTVHLFLQNGFEAPLPLYDSRRPERQSIHMEPNTHVHANWVFSQPGVHLVDVEVRGTDTQGVLHSTYTTVRFAVGDAASADRARSARSAGQVEGSASPTASSSGSSSASTQAGSPSQRPAAGQPSAGIGGWVVVAAIGLGVVVVGLVVAAVRRRRVRRAVWGKPDGEEEQR